MGSASLPSSIVNLVKGIIGSGILSLPYIFGQTGVLLGLVLLLFCAVAQCFTLHLLVLPVLTAQSRSQDVSFHSLAEAALGGRQVATTLVSICVILVAFGDVVSYLIVIGDLLPEVLEYVGARGDPWTSRTFWITAIAFLLELPLSCLSNMDSLKVSSMFGNIGIMYITFVVCLFASGAIVMPLPVQHVSIWPPTHTAHTSMSGLVMSLPIFIFAFSCAEFIPTLIVELRDNTVSRINAMIIIAIAICTVVFMIVGICGSVTFGSSVEGDLLKSFPNEQSTAGGFLSLFARFAIVINMVGVIPLCIHPLRAIVSSTLCGKASTELRFLGRGSLSFVVLLLSWSLAITIPSLEVVLALLGSTAAMLIGFSLPTLFYCLGVQPQVEDNMGISLQERSQIRFQAEVDVTIGSGFRLQQNRGAVRKVAWLVLFLSLIMIPVLLGIEMYKLLHGF